MRIKINKPKKNDSTSQIFFSERDFIRISVSAKVEEQHKILDKLNKGEIKWVFYAKDNDKGFHYYEKK